MLRALEEMDIHFDYDQENEVFNYRLSTELTTYRQRLVPLEEQELLLAITNFPIIVPEDTRFLMTNLLNKLNHSLILGHYVMEPEDGEISFRVSCPVDDGAINKTIVHVAIANSITTIDKHLPELLAAIGNLPTTAPALSNNKPMAYAQSLYIMIITLCILVLEAAELFAAARENAQWRYRSYLRMLSTNWTNEE